MKFIIYILIFSLFITGCANSNPNLVVVKKDFEIDLTELDSVRENLRGFWILENKIDSNEIIWLEFIGNSNSTSWETIFYNKENEKTKTLNYLTSSPFIELTKFDGKTILEFTSLSGRDTVEIEQLTKAKLKIYGKVYLRHKGYDFLKKQ
ncbi:hypothetical protein [Tenacibaculum ovolyticum]|uniref:hypothetical protein n=1 Tax=Tenacibaculum ovolyticum TaxID=104270 RepID=UPI003BA92393